MFEFFRSLFNPAPPSGTTAKERLRLVLLSDHLSLAPDVIEAMKRDLLEVFSRYVEIDTANADVTFEQRESEVAMLASVPILGVRDRKEAIAAVAAQATTSAAEAAVEPAAEPAVPVAETPVAPEMPASVAPVAPVVAKPDAVQAPRSANPGSARRRRRKKAANQNGQQGQPQLGPPGIAASQA